MAEPSVRGRPELWGGVECTINRVGDRFFDQLALSGHDWRLADLDAFARLPLAALRYPVLWERHCPAPGAPIDWGWAAARLERLRELGIRPIAGLVHHGSGPAWTNLLDPGWPAALAAYAGAVAERFPWLDAYTPVNEPLTTARFSCLYGHWYPHRRDAAAWARALLHQCQGAVLAMRAIRAVNPRAQFIQTDDLGKTWSTPALDHQAEFENERRWLGFELVAGRVGPGHPLRDFLVKAGGLAESELDWLREHACPPDIAGLNYYLTSERFLDHRLDGYPAAMVGGNGRDRYADVEAVRVRAGGIGGIGLLAREAWQRLGLPLAVTEVHLGCTREEQLRWFAECWAACCALRAAGVDLRAVTAWSLLGAFNWDSLVTRDSGGYEPGVFDLRKTPPRPTALAGVLGDCAAGRIPGHPAAGGDGWWRRPGRYAYGFAIDAATGERLPAPVAQQPAASAARSAAPWPASAADRRQRPLLIVGAGGTLGQAFGRICAQRGLPCALLRRAELDIADPAAVAAALAGLKPWAVVNAAGYVRVDDAELELERCFRDNALGPAVLADACAEQRLGLLTFSSDLVFDGRLARPYRETDPVAPLSAYGRSKAEAERRVLAAHPAALVIRTSAFFGPWDRANFVTRTLAALARDGAAAAANDALVSPTYVPDVVHASLDLLIDGEAGLWHLANQGAVSWYGLARRAAALAGFDPAAVSARPLASLGLRAARPSYSALDSGRGRLLPDLDAALARYVCERDSAPAA